MENDRKTGVALVCPDALIREQLRMLAPDRQDARGAHAGPACIQTRHILSFIEKASGTKKEA
ncbi:MAG TPA: hypothetical protein VEM40_11855 [Nitrospirota bacterium]|nr:hypothetical protein [Nitrospirota bacterium]